MELPQRLRRYKKSTTVVAFLVLSITMATFYSILTSTIFSLRAASDISKSGSSGSGIMDQFFLFPTNNDDNYNENDEDDSSTEHDDDEDDDDDEEEEDEEEEKERVGSETETLETETALLVDKTKKRDNSSSSNNNNKNNNATTPLISKKHHHDEAQGAIRNSSDVRVGRKSDRRRSSDRKTESVCPDFTTLCAKYYNENMEYAGAETISSPQKQQHDNQQIATTTTTTTTIPTLASLDPALRGGFRNQYMRLVAFVAHSIQGNYTQILLPSMRWFNRKTLQAIPWNMLYDVDHWNTHAQQQQQQNSKTNSNNHAILLPKLVPYDPLTMPDWDPNVDFYHGTCNILKNPRQWADRPGAKNSQFDSKVSQFTHPQGFGGGRILGTMWNTYKSLLSSSASSSQKDTLFSMDQLEEAITHGLKPSTQIQNVIKTCVKEHVGQSYVALHARVEDEFLVHSPCMDRKQKNLTQIVHHMVSEIPQLLLLQQQQQQLVDNGNDHSSVTTTTTSPKWEPDSIFMAIDRNRMGKWPFKFENSKRFHEENVKFLKHISREGITWPTTTTTATSKSSRMDDTTTFATTSTTKRQVPLSECGAIAAHSLDPCMQETAAALINFEIAVHADVFIGTSISTYSISVWKARYFKGIGNNFEYNKEGIRKIEGMPESHKC